MNNEKQNENQEVNPGASAWDVSADEMPQTNDTYQIPDTYVQDVDKAHFMAIVGDRGETNGHKDAAAIRENKADEYYTRNTENTSRFLEERADNIAKANKLIKTVNQEGRTDFGGNITDHYRKLLERKEMVKNDNAELTRVTRPTQEDIDEYNSTNDMDIKMEDFR